MTCLSLLLHLQQYRSVTRHSYSILGTKRFDVLMRPDIPSRPYVCKLQLGPLDSNFRVFLAAIEDRYSSCTTGKRSCPDFLITCLQDLLALHSKFVLINRDHFFVCEY